MFAASMIMTVSSYELVVVISGDGVSRPENHHHAFTTITVGNNILKWSPKHE